MVYRAAGLPLEQAEHVTGNMAQRRSPAQLPFHMGEVFPGAAYEGKTFLPMMEEMRRRRAGLEAVCVADAGMFGEENLAGLESAGHRYIVGARLRSLSQALQDRIVETGRYRGAAFPCNPSLTRRARKSVKGAML